MDAETIREIIREDETLTLECKKAAGGLPKALWETYSAFANTSGGTILLGIEELKNETQIEKKFRVTGVPDPKKLIQSFWDHVNNRSTISANILSNRDVGITDVDDRPVVWIRVPEVPYKDKPVYRGQDPFTGTYKRNFRGDYHCKRSEVRAMMRDATDDLDGRILERYSPSDLDFESVRLYRQQFENRRPDHHWNSMPDQEFLSRIGALRISRENGNICPTAAGLLMFGKGMAVNEAFVSLRLDYRDMTNLLPGQRWRDRLMDDGSWEYNLYNYVRLALPKMTSDLPSPFQMADVVREDDSDVRKALREALINMVIHCDYRADAAGPVLATKQEWGFSFGNPGIPLTPIPEIYAGTMPVTRNPGLQKIFLLIGYGENMGSGFSFVQKVWKDHEWRSPLLSEDTTLGRTELKLWMRPAEDPQAESDVQGIVGKRAFEALSFREQTILSSLRVEGELSSARAARLLGVSRADAKNVLLALMDRGFVAAEDEKWIMDPALPDYQKKMPVTTGSHTETDEQILSLLQERDRITSKDVVENTELQTSAGATAALRRLRSLNLVKQIREGRSVYYVLTNRGEGKS